MKSDSESVEMRRRGRLWCEWWLPGSWTLWSETWLLSLAVHLAAAILAALAIRSAPPARQIEILSLRADFSSALSMPSRQPLDSARRVSFSLASAQLGKVSPATAAEPAAIPEESPQDPDSAPSIKDGGSSPDLAEAMALVAGLQRRRDGPVAGGTGLVQSLQQGTGRGRPGIKPGLDVAAVLAADAKIPRPQHPTGPTASLSLFGAAAEGRSFVFVIDRSASMGSEGLGVLQIAAKELAGDISSLSIEQSFQVVAYNESVAYLYGRDLLPASDENQHKLVRFVADLAAFGQTDHTRALLAALKLKPEVIFLISDGGEPQPDAGQIRVIREAAAGRTSIHCLHFGRDPSAAPSLARSFLSRLAHENGGRYAYIDVRGR